MCNSYSHNIFPRSGRAGQSRGTACRSPRRPAARQGVRPLSHSSRTMLL
ncbi:MAG: hypothetical protein IJT90_07560 [Bacteroidaceae bacterium]|nr:hypothetical protein [Bacteroidaceae bacterium]